MTAHGDTDGDDPIGDALAGWDPETNADPHTARVQTRRAAEYLQDISQYRRAGQVTEELADESMLTRRRWWLAHVRPGLHHLADQGLITHIRNYGYRWADPDHDDAEP